MTDKILEINGIAYKNLSPTERDFIDILPERYRAGSLEAYKDFRKLSRFGSVFERSKQCTTWMSAWVTAVHFVMKQDEPTLPTSGAQ